MKNRQTDAGFTLIEALIAMVILGLGAISLLTAAEGYTGRVTDVTHRVAARWVAENALAEARLGLPIANQDIEMYALRFDVILTVLISTDPDLAALSLRVAQASTEKVLFVLDGYVPTRNLP